jgi:hypothetical protein
MLPRGRLNVSRNDLEPSGAIVRRRHKRNDEPLVINQLLNVRHPLLEQRGGHVRNQASAIGEDFCDGSPVGLARCRCADADRGEEYDGDVSQQQSTSTSAFPVSRHRNPMT